ncbi:MAG: hypothetical protein WCA01_00490 [Burkholderiales bacterium]|jgi:hypothetical protein
MKKKEHDDELPPLYEVEVMPVERRLNAPDRRAGKRKKVSLNRRRHPGRRATDPKPRARKKA